MEVELEVEKEVKHKVEPLYLSQTSIAAVPGPSQPPLPPGPLASLLTQYFARARQRRSPLLPLPQPPMRARLCKGLDQDAGGRKKIMRGGKK